MPPIDDPFRAADGCSGEMKGEADVVVVDFHAEATSEKQALARYLDGRVAAVVGTHTHVQTADERMQPKGNGRITDLGLTGGLDGIIGMKAEISVDRQLRRPAASGCSPPTATCTSRARSWRWTRDGACALHRAGERSLRAGAPGRVPEEIG
jgi:hypothetical protein